MPLDKIQGAILGHALGDALGLPSEFPPYIAYTGELVQNRQTFRFKGTKVFSVGQTSDDTEMALALIYSLREQQKQKRGQPYSYDSGLAIKSYLAWGNSGCTGMGNNTRDLFKGVTTVAGYKSRYAKIVDFNQRQSNGPLMRCYPLGLLGLDPMEDCQLTNPAQICLEAVKVYCQSIHHAATSDMSKDIIYQTAVEHTTDNDLLQALHDASSEFSGERDITQKRGWIAHAFYCAYWALLHFDDYQSGIDAVIQHSVRGKTVGDTDTNAAIAGALCGAYYGLDAIRDNQRTGRLIDTLLQVNTAAGELPRPKEYEMTSGTLQEVCNILSP